MLVFVISSYRNAFTGSSTLLSNLLLEVLASLMQKWAWFEQKLNVGLIKFFTLLCAQLCLWSPQPLMSSYTYVN